MLKIVTVEPAAGGAMLQLEGQVIGPWVEELRRACDQQMATGSLSLDLSHVSFVERRGVELLQSLGARGVPLLRCSAFVNELLRVQP